MRSTEHNESFSSDGSPRNDRLAESATSDDFRNADLAVAEAMEEYLALLETKKPIDRNAFLAKHPDIAERLVDTIESLDFVNRLASSCSLPGMPAVDSFTSTHSEIPESAEELGDFRIIREIGRGGMGVVYEAEQRSLGRRVALKVMPFASLLDPRHIERFRNEARAAAMLRHPNIVSVHSVGCERGVHYYAMDLIDGHSLAEILARLNGPDGIDIEPNSNREFESASESGSVVTPKCETVPFAKLSTEHSSDRRSYFRSVAQLGIQAAEALHYAHQSGVVHRDIKPSNLLLDQTGNVHVADFGLARIQASESMTMTGNMVGTLRYMSPEQIDGHVADERSDVYSLGATLFELTTLRPPFVEHKRNQLMRAILESPAPFAHKLERDVPQDLATIVDKCLQKNPTARYRNAMDVAEDLHRYLDHRLIQAKPTNSFQRLRNFARRNPALTTSLAAAFVLMSLLSVVSSLLTWNYSIQIRSAIVRSKQAAIVSRLQRIGLYAHEMRAAKRLADERRLVELQEALLRWVPSEGEEDFRNFEWYHLWQYCDDPAVIHTFDHELPMFEVSFLSNDEIVTSGFASRAKIWPIRDNPTGKPRAFLKMPHTIMEANYYDRVRNRLFTSDGAGNTYVWDPSSGTLLQSLALDGDTSKGLINNADSLSLTKDGRLLAVGSGSNELGQVRVFDLETGFKVIDMERPGRALGVLGTNDELVICGSNSDEIQIVDSHTGDTIKSFSIDATHVRAVAMSDDTSLIAFGVYKEFGTYETHRVELWNALEWRPMWTLTAVSRVNTLAFAHDGSKLAWGDRDGNACVVELETDGGRGEVWPPRRVHPQVIHGIDFSPDNTMLATASSDSFATVWDLAELRKNSTSEVSFPKNRGSIGSCFLDNQDTVATSYRTIGAVLWDATTGEEIRTINVAKPFHEVYVDSAPEKQLLGIVMGFWPAPKPGDSRRSEIVIWDNVRKRNRAKFDDLPPMGCSTTGCSFSPDGRFFAVCSHDEGVIVIDVESKQVLHKLGHVSAKTLRFSRDSKTLVIGLTDGLVQVASVPEFAITETLRMEDRLVDSIDISSDGRFIAALGFERQVKLYDRVTGETRAFEEKMPAFPPLVRFAPDGKRILTASLDGKLRLWITETGDQVMSWDLPSNDWPMANFSSDGEAFTVGAHNYAKVVHARHADQLRRLSASALRTDACQKVSNVDW